MSPAIFCQCMHGGSPCTIVDTIVGWEFCATYICPDMHAHLIVVVIY